MNRKLKKLLRQVAIILLILALTYILQWASGMLRKQQISQASSYQVTKVFDGDTIEVNMDGTLEKVRFIGIDTPETGGHDTGIECYGPEASSYTKAQLQNQYVLLIADSLSSNRDRYNRLLRYVYRASDNLDMNLSILQHGYSKSYSIFPFERSQEFKQASRTAEQNNLGLWAACG